MGIFEGRTTRRALAPDSGARLPQWGPAVSDAFDVDRELVRRVSVKTAARYLGCSSRHVLDLIRENELPGSIDVSSKGAKRATWGIPVHALRSLIVRRELRAAEKIGVEGMKEPAHAKTSCAEAQRER